MKASIHLFVLCLLLGLGLFARSAMALEIHALQYYGGGYVHGCVFGFNQYGRLIPLGWVPIQAYSPLTHYRFQYSTYANGCYGFYLPVGSYNVTISEPGFVPKITQITVSDGSSSGATFILERSNIPIPEFPSSLIVLMTVLALAMAVLVKRRRR